MRSVLSDGRVLSIGLCLLLGTGCIGGGPADVQGADVDPESAAAEAMKVYDKNGDGALADAELDQIPAIATHVDRYDANSDGRVSEDELATRLKSHYGSGVGLMQVDAVVYFDRAPLEGATVRAEPEAFLGDSVQAAEGVTNRTGMARVAVPDEQLPDSDRGLNAMQIGLYKIKITHPTRQIPAKYNENTTLGLDLDPQDQSAPKPTYNLTSR